MLQLLTKDLCEVCLSYGIIGSLSRLMEKMGEKMRLSVITDDHLCKIPTL